MFERRNERELSWKLLLGLVAFLRSARSATMLLRGQQKASKSVSVNHGGEAMGTAVSRSFFFFFGAPPPRAPLPPSPTEPRMAESLEIYEAPLADL